MTVLELINLLESCEDTSQVLIDEGYREQGTGAVKGIRNRFYVEPGKEERNVVIIEWE